MFLPLVREDVKIRDETKTHVIREETKTETLALLARPRRDQDLKWSGLETRPKFRELNHWKKLIFANM